MAVARKPMLAWRANVVSHGNLMVYHSKSYMAQMYDGHVADGHNFYVRPVHSHSGKKYITRR